MKNNVTRILASLLALAALALGGSAIASAMNGNNSSDQTPAKASENATGGESESGPEGADDNGSETGPEGADDNAAESEQDGSNESGNEQADAGEVVGSTATAKATAAAERETGGKAADVSAETNDAPEKGDASDPAEAVSPAGAAYEVDVTKGNKELKVYLDSQFQVLEVQADQ